MSVQPTEQLRRGATVYLGADPELFVVRGPKEWVVGSERVLPAASNAVNSSLYGIARDGVQIEFQFPPGLTCRQGFAAELRDRFVRLDTHIKQMNAKPQKYLKELKACFKTMVKVTPAELNRLSPDSRVLGCAPSLNLYDGEAKLGVDPATYRYRSAGGHIHLGLDRAPLKRPEVVRRIVKVMDILVGNTSVMIDRDPNAAERRKVYGRAGEYRIPAHGLEYRTLSNFWLRSYPLMSMMLGISRMSVQVIAQTDGYFKEYLGPQFTWNVEKALLDRVDIKKIQKAINENDLALAKENFTGVEDFIRKYTTHYGDAVNAHNLDAFKYFLQKIEEKGIEYWFPDDPMTYWTMNYNSGIGCERFLDSVKAKMAAEVRPTFS